MTTITFETVSAAADALINEDQKPTLVNIRSALGGGSFSTISPLLKQWRDQQVTAIATAPIVEAAPDEINEQANTLVSNIWQAALNLSNARLSAERETLEQTRLSLEAERDEAAELADLVNDDLEKANAQIEALIAENSGITNQLDHLEKKAAESAQALSEQTQDTKDAQTAAASAQSRADELAQLLTAEQGARDRLEAEASAMHDREKDLTAQVATLQAKLEASDAAKDDLQSKLTKASSELARETIRAESTAARLDAAALNLEKAEKSASIVQAEAKGASENAAELRGRITELEKQLKQLKNKATTPPTQAKQS